MTTNTSNPNIAVCLRFAEEICNQGKLELIPDVFAPDYVNHQLPPTMPQGPQGEAMFVGMFRAAFPDMRVDPQEWVADGDRVVCYCLFSGTHKGDFLGIPATGKSFRVNVMNLFRLRDGKIVENRSIFDQMTMMQQLGVIPSPAQA